MKRVLQYLLLIFIILNIQFLYAEDFTLEKQIDLGTSYFQQGLFKKSIIQYNSVLEKITNNDNKILVLNNLGIAYTHEEKYEKAIVAFKKIITIAKKKQDKAVAYNNIGFIYTEQKKYNKAINHLQRAIELVPSYSDPYNNLGDVFQAIGDMDNAIKNWKKAISYNPQDVDAIINLSDGYIEKRRFKEAIDVINIGRTILPENILLFAALGRIYHLSGYYDSAIIIYKEVVNAVPNTNVATKAYQSLSVLYNDKSTYLSAQEDFEYRIQQNSRDINAYNEFGRVLDRLSLYQKALAIFFKGLKINPDNIELNFNVGAVYEKIAKIEEAKKYYKKTLKLNPRHVDALRALGDIYYQEESYQESLSFYNKLINLNAGSIEYYYKVGLGYLEIQNYFKALKFLKRVYNIDNRYKSVTNLLIKIYPKLIEQHKKDDINKAIRYLSELLELSPTDYKYRYILGELFYKTGKYSRAIDELIIVKTHLTDYLSTYKYLALSYYNIKNYFKTVDNFRKYFSKKDVNHELRKKFGLALFNIKEYQESLTQLLRYKKHYSKDYGIYRYIGENYYILTDYIKAVEFLTEYTSKFPKDSYGWELLGLSYYHQKKYSKSIKSLKKSTDIEHTKRNLFHLGISYYRLKLYDNSKAVFQEYVDIDKDNHNVYYYLADLYRLSEEYRLGLESINRCIYLRSDYNEAIPLKAELLFQLKDYKKSLDWFHKSIETFGVKKDYSLRLKDINSILGKENYDKAEYMTAITYFNSALAIDSNIIDILNLKGYGLYKLGKNFEAIQSFEKSIKNKFDQLEIHQVLAEIYQKTGQYDTAIYYFNNVRELSKSSPALTRKLIVLYEKTQNDENLIKQFKELIRFEPDQYEHYYKLAKIYHRIRNLDDAVKYYLTAYEKTTESKLRDDIITFIKDICVVYFKDNKFQNVINKVKYVESQTFLEDRHKVLVYDELINLCKVYTDTKMFNKASGLYQSTIEKIIALNIEPEKKYVRIKQYYEYLNLLVTKNIFKEFKSNFDNVYSLFLKNKKWLFDLYQIYRNYILGLTKTDQYIITIDNFVKIIADARKYEFDYSFIENNLISFNDYIIENYKNFQNLDEILKTFLNSLVKDEIELYYYDLLYMLGQMYYAESDYDNTFEFYNGLLSKSVGSGQMNADILNRYFESYKALLNELIRTDNYSLVYEKKNEIKKNCYLISEWNKDYLEILNLVSIEYYSAKDFQTALDIYNEILSIADENENIPLKITQDYFNQYITKVKELVGTKNYEYIYKLKPVIYKNCYYQSDWNQEYLNILNLTAKQYFRTSKLNTFIDIYNEIFEIVSKNKNIKKDIYESFTLDYMNQLIKLVETGKHEFVYSKKTSIKKNCYYKSVWNKDYLNLLVEISDMYFIGNEYEIALDIFIEILSISSKNKNITTENTDKYFNHYITRLTELIKAKRHQFIITRKTNVKSNCYLKSDWNKEYLKILSMVSDNYYQEKQYQIYLDNFNEILQTGVKNKNISDDLTEKYFKDYTRSLKKLIDTNHHELVFNNRKYVKINCYYNKKWNIKYPEILSLIAKRYFDNKKFQVALNVYNILFIELTENDVISQEDKNIFYENYYSILDMLITNKQTDLIISNKDSFDTNLSINNVWAEKYFQLLNDITEKLFIPEKREELTKSYLTEVFRTANNYENVIKDSYRIMEIIYKNLHHKKNFVKLLEEIKFFYPKIKMGSLIKTLNLYIYKTADDIVLIEKYELAHDFLQFLLKKINNKNPLYSQTGNLYNKMASMLQKTNKELANKYFKISSDILNRDIKTLYEYAMFLFEKGNYKKSIKYFDKLIKVDKQNIKGYYYRGYAYYNLKKYDKAIKQFLKVINIKPLDFESLKFLGRIYFLKKDYSNTEYYLIQAKEVNKGDVEVLYLLGVAQYYLDKWAESITNLRSTYNIDMKYRDVQGFFYKSLINEAYRTWKTGHYKKAVKNILESEKIKYEVPVHHDLGKIYKILEQYNKAIDAWQTVLKHKPDNIITRRELAKIYRELAEYDLSIIEYNKILIHIPQDLSANINLLYLYELKKDKEKMDKIYQRLISILKNDPDIRYDYANFLISYDAAPDIILKYFQDAVQRAEKNIVYRMTYAKYLRKYGHIAESLKQYRQILKYDPKNKLAIANIGDIYFMNSKYKTALKYFLQVMDSRKTDSLFLFNSAVSYFNIKDYNKALKYFNLSLAIDPLNIETRYYIGKVYYLTDKYAKAYKILTEIYRKLNDYKDVYEITVECITKWSYDLINNERYLKASETLKYGIALDTDNYTFADRLARISYKTQKVDAALKYFEICNSILPDTTYPLYRISTIYFEDKKDYKKSEEFIKRAILINNKEVRLHKKYVQIGKALNDTPTLIEEYNILTGFYPSSSEVYFNLGVLYKSINEIAQAQAAFKKAIEFNPANTEYLRVYANYMYDLGLFDEAQKYFEMLKAVSTDNLISMFRLGRIYMYKFKYDNAISVFNIVRKQNAKYPYAARYIGLCYEETGKTKDAIAEYKTALLNQPEDTVSMLHLGDILFYSADFENALYYYKHYKEVAGTVNDIEKRIAETNYHWAKQYNNKMQYLESVYRVSNSLKLFPQKYEYLFLIAQDYFGLGKFEETRKYTTKIFKQNSTDIPALKLEFYTLIKQDDIQSAIDVGEKILKQISDMTIRKRLTELYSKLGEKEGELQQLSQVVKEEPDNDSAILRFAKLNVETGKLQVAENILKTTLEKHPDKRENILLEKQLFDVLNKSNKIDEAVVIADNILKKEPDNIKIKYRKALNLYMLKEYNKSDLIFDNLLQKQNLNVNYLYYSGMSKYKTETYNGSIQRLEKILHLDRIAEFSKDKQYDIFYILGKDYFKLKNYPKTVENWLRAAQINQSDKLTKEIALAYKSIGLEKYNNDLYEEARKNFLESYKYYDSDADVTYYLGDILFKRNKYNKALEYWNKTSTIDPSYPLIFAYLGQVNTRLEKWDDAIANYEKAVKYQEGNPTIYQALVDLYKMRKDYPKVVSAYKNLQKIKLDDAKIPYELGMTHFNNGNYSLAIDKFKETLQIRPDYVDAYKMLGRIAFLRKNYKLAKNYFNQGMMASPDRKDIQHLLCQTYVKMKDYSNAIKAYERFIVIDPANPVGYKEIGDIYKITKDYVNAVRYYVQTFEHHPLPEFAYETHKQLGIVYLNLKQYEDSIKEFKKGLKIVETDKELYSLLSKAQYYQGDRLFNEHQNKKSVEFFKKAHENDNDNLKSLFMLGKNYLVLEDYDNALASWKELEKYNPSYEKLNKYLGRIYLIKHNYEKAISYFLKAQAKDSEDAEVNDWIVSAYKAKGSLEDVISQYRNMVSQNPTDLNARIKLAVSYFYRGMVTEAEEELKYVVKKAPQNIEAKYHLAQVYMSRQYMAGAQKLLEYILQRVPQKIDANYDYGFIKFSQTKYQEALKYFNIVANLNSEYKKVNYYLGEIYYKLKQYNKSVEYYKKHLVQFTDDIVIRRKLISIYKQRGLLNIAKKEYIEAINNLKGYKDSDDQLSIIYNDLGNVELIMGDVNASIRSFKQAIRYNNAYFEPYYSLGDIYYESGYTDTALYYLNMAKNRNPSNNVIFERIGDVFYQKENFQSALKNYKNSLNVEKYNPGVEFKIGRIYYKLNVFDKARMFLIRALNKGYKNSQIYYYLADIDFNTGQKEKAIKYYLGALKHNPSAIEEINIYLSLGEIYIEKEKFENAIEFLIKLNGYSLSNNQREKMCFMLGKSFYYTHKYNKSEEYLSIAIKTNKDEPQNYYYLGLLKFDQQQIPQALQYVEMAVANNTEYFPAYKLMGDIYFSLNRYTSASTAYEKYLSFNTTDHKVRGRLGNIYLIIGSYREAILQFQYLIASNPSRRIVNNAKNSLSRGYIEEGMYKKAIGILESLIAQGYINDIVYLNLGEAYFRDNNIALAKKTLQKGLKINPGNVQILNITGEIEYQDGNLKNAIEFLMKAGQMSSDFAEPYYTLGYIYKNMENYGKAKEYLNMAIHRNSYYSEARLLLSEIFSEEGKFPLAVQQLKKVIDYNPKYSKAYNNLGSIYSIMGVYDKALNYYQNVIEINPESKEAIVAHNNIGNIYDKKGLYLDAINEYKKVLELDKDNYSAIYNMGLVYFHKGLYDDAFVKYMQVIKLNPERPDAYYNVSLIYYLKGKYKDAEFYIESAINLDPRNYLYYYHAGQIYLESNDIENAIIQLMKSIKINPDYPMSHINLGLCYYYKGRYSLAKKEYETAVALKPVSIESEKTFYQLRELLNIRE